MYYIAHTACCYHKHVIMCIWSIYSFKAMQWWYGRRMKMFGFFFSPAVLWKGKDTRHSRWAFISSSHYHCYLELYFSYEFTKNCLVSQQLLLIVKYSLAVFLLLPSVHLEKKKDMSHSSTHTRVFVVRICLFPPPFWILGFSCWYYWHFCYYLRPNY